MPLDDRVKQFEPSGVSAAELFVRGQGLTYADFTVLDTHFTDVVREEISLATDLGNGFTLETPIIASPMDTVTNDRVCTAIALQGGVGVIHYNHKDAGGKPDIDAQVQEVRHVKRFQNGFIESPVTAAPDDTIAET